MSETITPRVRVPAQAAAGEAVTIRTLINHPMETGQRVAPDGEVVPRRIINRFTATFEGETVIDMVIEPAVSPNLQVEFEARVETSGTFVFRWEDDSGAVYTEEASISVS